MNHLVYYVRNGVMYFSIEMKVTVISGSDKPERLHDIAVSYDVRTIERLD